MDQGVFQGVLGEGEYAVCDTLDGQDPVRNVRALTGEAGDFCKRNGYSDRAGVYTILGPNDCNIQPN